MRSDGDGMGKSFFWGGHRDRVDLFFCCLGARGLDDDIKWYQNQMVVLR